MIVYCITHRESGKKYVGVTKYSFKKRLKGHLKSDSILGNSLRFHGIDAFIFEIVDAADSIEEIHKKEIFWIQKLACCHPHGYNLHVGGIGEASKGKKSWLKGKTMSEEYKSKISKGNTGVSRGLGVPKSEEHKRKMSESRKGKPCPQHSETLKKIWDKRRKEKEEMMVRIRIIQAEKERKLNGNNSL